MHFFWDHAPDVCQGRVVPVPDIIGVSEAGNVGRCFDVFNYFNGRLLFDDFSYVFVVITMSYSDWYFGGYEKRFFFLFKSIQGWPWIAYRRCSLM